MAYVEELRALIGHRRINLCGCTVVVENERGELLLQQRVFPEGRWCFPGGLMELGEAAEDTAKRELEEETSLRAQELSLIGVFSGFVAALITQLIFRFLENHAGEGKFYDFLLYTGIEGKPDLKSVAGSVKSGVSSAAARRTGAEREETTARHAARHQAAGSAPKASRRSGSSSGTYQGKH